MSKKQFRNIVKVANMPSSVKIEKGNKTSFYQIGEYVTTDVAEAVALLMMLDDVDERIWNNKIYCCPEEIEPRKCLYWLSGGDDEWINLDNYKKAWIECDYIFQEHYGVIIVDIISSCRTLGDVRKYFQDNLNMLDIYEFALSKNLIRL